MIKKVFRRTIFSFPWRFKESGFQFSIDYYFYIIIVNVYFVVIMFYYGSDISDNIIINIQLVGAMMNVPMFKVKVVDYTW